ncbi:glycosyltransferase family 32 protein [Gallibacterium anatis]|uniref:glycosyltransferase family 32 protein n=1 Tax=Gallibacterium anatis TaxID=750 RepID=UPI003007C79A
MVFDNFIQQSQFYFDLYRHFLLCRDDKSVKQILLNTQSEQVPKLENIPRVLHYCWFGGNHYPDIVKRCMESWQNQEGFFIKLWNEDNFPVELYPFAEQALQQKKWAMVSDVARLHALYYEGGVYLDTDMELIKSLSPLLKLNAFACIESKRLVSIGLAGAKPFHPCIGKVLSWYKLPPFRPCYGIIANTRIISRMIELHYRIKLDGHPFKLRDGMQFYSYDYFLPRRNVSGEFILTENTIAIHHGTGLW